MLEYISDSENDSGGEINPRNVPWVRIDRVIRQLPEEDQTAVKMSLHQSGYGIPILSQNENNDQVLDEYEDANTTREELDGAARIYNIDELFSDITYSSQEANDIFKSQDAQQVPLSQVQEPLEHGIDMQTEPTIGNEEASNDEEEERENATHLRAYLGSKENVYSRRGLRNRSFANTYPYLADSSHWMGLASISILNELYKENNDVELIVKILNQKYIRNKERYPKDDKFKHKNFYAFLGKGKTIGSKSTNEVSQSNQVESLQSQQTDNFRTQDIEFSEPRENYSDDNCGFFGNSHFVLQPQSYDSFWQELAGHSNELIDIRSFHTPVLSEEIENVLSESQEEIEEKQEEEKDEDEEKEDEEDDDTDPDTMVRVGGKLLKERSILRGTLPESAKRLAIYQRKQKVHKKFQPRVVENRKGLAIKKKTPKILANLNNEFSGFFDDDEYYNDDNDIYVHAESPTFMDNFHTPIIAKKTSDITSSLEEPTEVIVVEDDNIDNVSVEEAISDWEVIEEDTINPMFAYRGTPSRSKKSTSNFKSAPLGETLNKRRRIHGIPHKKPPQRRQKQSILIPSHSLAFNYNNKTPPNTNTKSRGQSVTNQQRKTTGSKVVQKDPSNWEEGVPKASHNHGRAKNELKSKYEFSRNPVLSTVSVEVDSEKRFIDRSEARHRIRYSNKSGNSQHGRLFDGVTFPKGFILASIDIKKLGSLKNGYSNVLSNDEDSIILNLFGEVYSFSLLNKQSAQKQVNKLLRQLSKVLRESKYLQEATLETELYNAIGGLIRWSLILQELPHDEGCWLLLYKICNDFDRTNDVKLLRKKLYLLPYFILLLHIWIQTAVGQGVPITSKYPKGTHYFSKIYFKLLFENFDVEEIREKLGFLDDMITEPQNFNYHFESMYTLYLVNQASKAVSSEENWWSAIDEGIKLTRHNYSVSKLVGVLDILHFISMVMSRKSYEAHSWKPFYSIYNVFATLHDSSSFFYDRFLDIVLQLNAEHFWNIEEYLLVMIYTKTITVRKFGNFDNEVKVPQLLGKLVSRDSIPDTSFFDRFMYLLFSFISELPVEGNSKSRKKRLMSKFFTSSQFVYKKGDFKHFCMYVNRINFILLLSQISNKIDHRGQLVDLIKHIETSNDLDFYKVTVDGLHIYNDIVGEDLDHIPLESYTSIVNKIGDIYKSNKYRECIQIWEHIRSLMNEWKLHSNESHALILEVLEGLHLELFEDLFLLNITDMIYHSLNQLKGASSLGKKSLDVVHSLHEKSAVLLQVQMGRLPVSNDSNIISIIETSIKVWVLSMFIQDPGVNWSKLIFQRYPYIGNTYLRQRFNLFFYNELLQFIKLDEYFDTFFVVTLRCLVPEESSLYLATFFDNMRLSSLSSINLEILKFPSDIPQTISNLQFERLKPTLLKHILQNISASSISEQAKQFYATLFVNMLLEKVHIEMSNLQNTNEYIKCIGYLQRYCHSYLKHESSFKSLIRCLGLLQLDVDQYSWSDISLKQKLRMFHADFCIAVQKRDNKNNNSINRIHECLEKFVKLNEDDLDILFHLASIYIKSLLIRQFEKWILLYKLLEYLMMKLSNCEVNLTDGTFLNFLALLPGIGNVLFNKRENPFFSYQLLTIELIIDLLTKVYYTYDGYKDRMNYTNIVGRFIENLTSTSNTDIEPYSLLRIFDISASDEIKDFAADTNCEVEELDFERLTENLAALINHNPSTTNSLEFEF